MRTMPIVELLRLEEAEEGSFGVLRMNKQVVCVTLEPPDRQNEQNVSSIPAQQYICKPFDSPSHPGTFEVTNVPGRSAVLFHTGNTVANTKGCILLGTSYGDLSGQRAVLESDKAFALFKANLAGAQAFHLTISEHY